jgi:hypothetical protein
MQMIVQCLLDVRERLRQHSTAAVAFAPASAAAAAAATAQPGSLCHWVKNACHSPQVAFRQKERRHVGTKLGRKVKRGSRWVVAFFMHFSKSVESGWCGSSLTVDHLELTLQGSQISHVD